MTTQTYYEAGYCYPTSTFAKALKRYRQGCYYVQRRVGCNPPTIAAGPFETKREASKAARQLIAAA